MRVHQFSKIAGLMLVVILITLAVHYLPAFLAERYSDPLHAERALFYVMQGAKGLALFGLIVYLLPKSKYMLPVWFAIAWGVWEDALVVGCRLAIGIENSVTETKNPWEGICEQADMPYLLVLVPPLLAAAAWACLLHLREEHGKTLR